MQRETGNIMRIRKWKCFTYWPSNYLFCPAPYTFGRGQNRCPYPDHRSTAFQQRPVCVPNNAYLRAYWCLTETQLSTFCIPFSIYLSISDLQVLKSFTTLPVVRLSEIRRECRQPECSMPKRIVNHLDKRSTVLLLQRNLADTSKNGSGNAWQHKRECCSK